MSCIAAFLWYIGAEISKRSSASMGMTPVRYWSMLKSCPPWDNRTPFGRPVDPEVYIWTATSSGSIAATGSGSLSSKVLHSVEPSSTVGTPLGTLLRLAASWITRAIPASAATQERVAAGCRVFRGTVTSPPRAMPK